MSTPWVEIFEGGLREREQASCAVLVFVSPTCPVLKDFVSDWAPSTVGGNADPIIPELWISVHRTDRIGADVPYASGLGTSMTYAEDPGDVAEAGVLVVPVAFLVEKSGHVVRELRRRPVENELPHGCLQR